MNQAMVLSLIEQTVRVMLLVSAPALGAGLVVGVAVSIVQVLTSINDATLASLPRVVAIIAAGYLAFPWMMRILVAYTIELYRQVPQLLN